MLKRLLWLMIGIAFGSAVSLWIARSIRQTLERYTPERIRSDLRAGVKSLRKDLRVAIADGRVAMREREAEIRAELPAISR